MEKNKGFTLIELLVAMAILVIMVLMVAPLMSSISKSNKRTQELNQLDINVGRTIDVFKRAVRSSKPIESTWSVTGSAVYLANKDGGKVLTTSSVAIVVNVPKEISANNYTDEKVIFYYDDTTKKLMLNSTTTNTTSGFIGISNPVELVEDVLAASFGYDDNIATIYLKVKLDTKDDTRFKEIRDAAVTRINIQF